MRVAAIIEARMGSRRLPGKVMKTIKDVPMLVYMLERVWASQMIDTVVVATPDTPDNAGIWAALQDLPDGFKVVSGPEDDVLARVLKAAKATQTDVIVELTGDCPLIDPFCIDQCAGYFVADYDARTGSNAQYDFVGNAQPRTYPRGMDVRVFSTQMLERVNEEVKGDTREAYWREHVSPWMYDRDGSTYRCLNIPADPQTTYPDLNLSVDTIEDFNRIKGVIEALKPGNPMFSCHDAIEYLSALPGYENIDANRPSVQAPWIKDLVA